jgi:hypothetical protein
MDAAMPFNGCLPVGFVSLTTAWYWTPSEVSIGAGSTWTILPGAFEMFADGTLTVTFCPALMLDTEPSGTKATICQALDVWRAITGTAPSPAEGGGPDWGLSGSSEKVGFRVAVERWVLAA